MFSLTRRRREAERMKKMEEVFKENDPSGSGKISKEQLIKLFQAHDVIGENG